MKFCLTLKSLPVNDHLTSIHNIMGSYYIILKNLLFPESNMIVENKTKSTTIKAKYERKNIISDKTKTRRTSIYLPILIKENNT